MAIEIKEVSGKKGRKAFVNFPFQLYQDNPFWVPPLIRDELTGFDPGANPALEHCKVKYWMAFEDSKPVGRIAGILLDREFGENGLARFGWIDFIDDEQVSRLLLETTEAWARSEEARGLHGPLGFSDMDYEGMLIEGFDAPATIATIYNYPYYPGHLSALGYAKSVDWVEFKGEVPELSPRLKRKAEIIESRFKLRSLNIKRRKEAKKYGKELFDVLNSSYASLYGFHPLTREQIDFYIDQYLGFVVVDMLSLVVDSEGRLAGFAITMPSFTKAFQKARGKLFPFGFLHILSALKNNDTADLYLIGVLPAYQKLGVTTLIFRDLIKAYNERGIRYAVTNPMLESNQHVLGQFNEYQKNGRLHKKRRCFIKHFKDEDFSG